jgi:hypothetical protein
MIDKASANASGLRLRFTLALEATGAILNGDKCRKVIFMKTANASDVVERSKQLPPVPRPSALEGYFALPTIVDLLGGEAMIERRIESKIDVHELIRAGLPNGSVTSAC